MKILVAVDGSQASLHAVRHALQLVSQGLRADIVLATVQEPTYGYERVLPPSDDVLERLSGTVGTRALAGAESVLAESGLPYERKIGSGEAVPTLVEIAERQRIPLRTTQRLLADALARCRHKLKDCGWFEQ
jgi:nucleotide-binding universal stress UspA family protein